VFRRVARTILRIVIAVVIVVLALVGAAISVLETGWAKERLRGLMVRQANEYLTATLTINRLGGSILRGLELGDVRLSRDGHVLVAIDEIALSYSIRELVQAGTVIRRVRLTRPRFTLSRQPDGRWDIAAIVKRERQEGERRGPGRPIEIQSVEITDGRVLLNDPLDFGAAHAPTDFDALDASFSFAYQPVRWRLDFKQIAWTGRRPELSMNRLSGGIGVGPGGWFFDRFSVVTPRSAFELNGRVIRGNRPTELDLRVQAARFAFQEWSGVLRGLQRIAVDASFDTSLKGPLTQLGTDIQLTGTGGSVKGHLLLDTSVPGWRGAGAVDVGQLDLSRWLNDPQKPSNITGRVEFDLALELGRHFPRGIYHFAGPHAMYLNYAADDLDARGQITASEVLIARATGRAYGAGVATSNGSIGIDSPYPFRFAGRVDRIDLRRVPQPVPVPHVESLLTFDYDVSGRFSQPFIAGRATFFAPSVFLGASLGSGTTGTIDTSAQPVHYTGNGDIANISLRRFGDGLDVAWMRDHRYEGVLAGHFQVDGHGFDRDSMAITAGGRLMRAEMFHGTLSDADVTMSIENGSLAATYAGGFRSVDPAVAFGDNRSSATLTGTGSISASVQDLLTRDVTLDDYDVSGTLDLTSSSVRDVTFERARIEATLQQSQLTVRNVDATGAALDGRGSGTIAFAEERPSTFDYQIRRANLAQLRGVLRADATGSVAAQGHVSGPWTSLHVTGEGTGSDLGISGISAVSLNARYDIHLNPSKPDDLHGRVDARAGFVRAFGQSLRETTGTLTLNGNRVTADLTLQQDERRRATVVTTVMLRLQDRAIDVADATFGVGRSTWRRQQPASASTVTWSEGTVSITPTTFIGSDGRERVDISGTWRTDGGGALRLTGSAITLETLQPSTPQPPRYSGLMNFDVTLRGTREAPVAAGTVTIDNGRVDRVNYQKLAGRVDYAASSFDVDLRLDQSPGIWITAVGRIPLAMFDRDAAEKPLDVAIKSSGINLGLIEGATTVITNVTGQLLIDVRAAGSSHDPHFTGAVSIDGGGFQVAASGARYRNVRVGLTLAPDRVDVEVFHIEDSSGRPLDMRGSLGTHELQVGDLEMEITSKRFEVLRNTFGRMDIEAKIQLRGRFEAPLLTGELTINSGELKVDEILQRTLFQPYATEPAAITEVDAVAALNPWQRLGMNLTLHVPNTLRLVGENVQVSAGTPVGLGDINVRVAGDLYLYKDPGDSLYVNGSFDALSGTYAFQGRRFDVDPASSIIFRGDLSPELYVGVTRLISGVQTRVGLIGPLRQPELRLSSVPPLDESDILSLIVFNTSTNQLTTLQQQELVVRAGALAAGFLATPIISAISSEIGLDVLEIEPAGEYNLGPRLTVGQEIAPGLVARFSRQFGPEPYDEATIEYYLSRILRLRATFSDAQTLNARSPFRRVERAGIDLLFFFSF
jgi:autotransporter translocation and assembly factor TamB